MVFTCLVVIVCSSFNVIDSSGKFHGAMGELLNKLLKFIFGLNDDFMINSGVLSLILLPQFCSYLCSGVLSGCAVPPRFTSVVIRIFFLFMAKSFFTAAGVLFGLGVAAKLLPWNGVSSHESTGVIILSLFILMLGFYQITLCRCIEDGKNFFENIKKWRTIARINCFMTRCVNKKELDPLAKNIGDAIAKLRMAMGLTLEQVAQSAVMRNEALSQIEQGTVMPTILQLAKLAKVFECNIAELITKSSNRPCDQASHLNDLLQMLELEDRKMVVAVIEKITGRLVHGQ